MIIFHFHAHSRLLENSHFSVSAVIPQKIGTSSGIYGQPLHGVLHLIKREEWEAVQQSEGVGNPKSG
eukprot:397580-Pelagomonas_calceolata.AAC.6